MPEFKQPVLGRFGWVELQTKDPVAAEKFYGSLFGWQCEQMPAPGPRYTIATLGGRHVAGLTESPNGVVRIGAGPRWASYLNVKDVEATTVVAINLGGQVLVPATAMGPGKFAVVADPTGGVVMLWFSPEPMGTFLYGEPSSLTWNELVTTDTHVAERFYTKLFGWTSEVMEIPGQPYTVFKLGDVAVAGMMAQPAGMQGAATMWAAYFAVEDADATWTKALAAGAHPLVPLTDIPRIGRFGWLKDPQGAVFAIIQNATPVTA